MTKTQIKKTIQLLSTTDGVSMLDELISTIASDSSGIPVTDAQKTMMDECLEEIEKHPGRGMSHVQFCKQIKQAKLDLQGVKRRKSA